MCHHHRRRWTYWQRRFFNMAAIRVTATRLFVCRLYVCTALIHSYVITTNEACPNVCMRAFEWLIGDISYVVSIQRRGKLIFFFFGILFLCQIMSHLCSRANSSLTHSTHSTHEHSPWRCDDQLELVSLHIAFDANCIFRCYVNPRENCIERNEWCERRWYSYSFSVLRQTSLSQLYYDQTWTRTNTIVSLNLSRSFALFIWMDLPMQINWYFKTIFSFSFFRCCSSWTVSFVGRRWITGIWAGDRSRTWTSTTHNNG